MQDGSTSDIAFFFFDTIWTFLMLVGMNWTRLTPRRLVRLNILHFCWWFYIWFSIPFLEILFYAQMPHFGIFAEEMHHFVYAKNYGIFTYSKSFLKAPMPCGWRQSEGAFPSQEALLPVTQCLVTNEIPRTKVSCSTTNISRLQFLSRDLHFRHLSLGGKRSECQQATASLGASCQKAQTALPSTGPTSALLKACTAWFTLTWCTENEAEGLQSKATPHSRACAEQPTFACCYKR